MVRRRLRWPKYVTAPEQLFVTEKKSYLDCPNGYGKSRLPNTFLEKSLGGRGDAQKLDVRA